MLIALLPNDYTLYILPATQLGGFKSKLRGISKDSWKGLHIHILVIIRYIYFKNLPLFEMLTVFVCHSLLTEVEMVQTALGGFDKP
jgi:hypothetical protein